MAKSVSCRGCPQILLPLMGFGILAALAYVGLSNKEALKGFLEHFTDIVDDWCVRQRGTILACCAACCSCMD